MATPTATTIADRLFEMEPALLHLLTHEINSFGRWDALRYFLETDSEQATLDEIGAAVGRSSEVLLRILGELTTLGWLARRSQGGVTFYVLTQELDRRHLLDRLRASMHDHRFRLQVIYQWTRGL